MDFHRFHKNVIQKDMKRNWQSYLMILPALAFVLLFCYAPMYGVQLAFRDYRVLDGIAGSPWVGLKHLERFFAGHNSLQVIGNTLKVSLTAIVFGFPPPILFALLLNEVRHKRFQKTIQTITYIPHFISITVLVAMLFTFCNQSTGIINLLLGKFFHMQPVPLMQSERWFLFMFILSGIWQDMGYGSILYIATLSTVDPCLHEAAIIDGAHRGQRIWHINLPCLTPTIVIMLIMRMGSVINVGFEKVFLMQNSLNTNVSEVLSTYVYKLGLINSRYDFSTAVNLFTSVVNCTMLVAVNAISRKVSDHSLW